MNAFEVACSMVDNYTNSNAMQENVIEWVNSDTATVNLVANSRLANKVRKLAEERDDVNILSDENGVLLAHIPTKWVKINPPRELTEKQAEVIAEMNRRRIEKQSENQF